MKACWQRQAQEQTAAGESLDSPCRLGSHAAGELARRPRRRTDPDILAAVVGAAKSRVRLSFCAVPPMVKRMTAVEKAPAASAAGLAERGIWRAEMIDTL